METIIKPSSKRYSVDICGETFTTQKSLIEKVKSVFGELETHQEFIKAFVSTYEKVILQNTRIKKVYYGPNDYMRSYFKHSNCLHVVFEDNTEITVSYENIVSAWFDSEKAAIQKIKGDKLQEYRLATYPEVLDFRKQFWHSGCNDCKVNFSDLDSPVPHVDHCGDKEFRHIVADFEIQCEEKNFIEFHRSLAKYQLLCEDCHHKKSKRW